MLWVKFVHYLYSNWLICNKNILKNFQAESSFMTFEGIQIQGGPKIMEKLTVSTK